MNYSSSELIVNTITDIPKAIHKELLNLFAVHSVSELSEDEKEHLKTAISEMYTTGDQPNYDDLSKEYSLYYLPINMQKIWRPLLDLAECNCLKEKCDILELGAGPGSATFGLIEFYKYLAIENNTRDFILNITVVEQEKAFILILQRLFESYKESLPDNLHIMLKTENVDAFSYIEGQDEYRYDLIAESNMLNPNERIDPQRLALFAENVQKRLKRHSSVILIEPAKKVLTNHLRTVKQQLTRGGMGQYSPCSCNQSVCSQFASAQLDIRQINICKELYAQGIITKEMRYHSFEYAVFRNDSLKKHDYCADGKILSELAGREGELISFNAFALSIANPDKELFALKICDGSLTGNQAVWLNIPKNRLVDEQINVLTCGRGSLIKVKKAVVTKPNRLDICNKTQITIY